MCSRDKGFYKRYDFDLRDGEVCYHCTTMVPPLTFKQIVDAVSYNRQISYGWIFMKFFGKCIKWDKEQVVRCWECDLAILVWILMIF